MENLNKIAQEASKALVEEAQFTISDLLGNWIALALAGLGLSLAVNHFLGGLFLALAMAAIARRADPERGRGILLTTAFTAAVLAVVAAMIVEAMEWPIPVPLAMGIVGFFSRNLVSIALRFGARVEERQDQLIDRAIDRVIPEDKE